MTLFIFFAEVIGRITAVGPLEQTNVRQKNGSKKIFGNRRFEVNHANLIFYWYSLYPNISFFFCINLNIIIPQVKYIYDQFI